MRSEWVARLIEFRRTLILYIEEDAPRILQSYRSSDRRSAIARLMVSKVRLTELMR
jgi:hypothetical protein